ncbi:MAG: type II secretion system protein [Candidatus Sumerlaeia bacterium]|nr:type II secretion system protein [Candidatus Sumerlaeia bacterium]
MTHLPHRRRRGMTLLEILISSTIMLLVSTIVMTSMVYYLRIMAVLTVRQKMANDARLLESELSFTAATAASFALTTSGTSQRLTMLFPNGSVNGVSRGYEYRDGDNDPDTIGNNSIVELDANGNVARTLATDISPVTNGVAIFAQDPARPNVDINVRFGDRADNPNVAGYQNQTGPGFQTYVLRTSIVPGNAP